MSRNLERSREVFAAAQKVLPGGVDSPVRSFRGVGGDPVIVASGSGSRMTDVDGNSYVDFCSSWGPLILGHAAPAVVEAVREAAGRGLSYGAATEAEVTLANLVCDSVPSIEMVRFVNSGTEATMSALRLARAFTGRSRIVKFEGCYHGHGDALLVKAGSGALTLGQPSSAGVPPEVAARTLVLPYNDTAALEAAFAAGGAGIAAVIVEPVAGNMNLVLPKPGFLQTLRQLTARHGAVLIFDEVMTGFRVGLRGAAGYFGITPDLVTLGKVLGGGMPLGAFGGRRDIMACVAPLGPVYQAGTLSGNPVAVAAGLATLRLIQAPSFFERLAECTRSLTDGLTAAARDAGIAFSAQAIGGMFGVYFRSEPPTTYAEVLECDREAFNRFFHAMLRGGVYLAPSAYEAGFVSAAHGDEEVDRTIEAARRAFAEADD